MELEVKAKLLNTLSQFVGATLKGGSFKEMSIGGVEFLILELTFSEEGVYHKMVLVLDKDLAEGDYKEIAERILK